MKLKIAIPSRPFRNQERSHHHPFYWVRYIRADRRRVKCVTQLTARATSPCVNTSTNTLPGVNICSVNMATCWQRLKQCALLWVGSCLKSGRRWDAAALKHTAGDSGTTVPQGTTVLGQVLEWSWHLISSATEICELLTVMQIPAVLTSMNIWY